VERMSRAGTCADYSKKTSKYRSPRRILAKPTHNPHPHHDDDRARPTTPEVAPQIRLEMDDLVAIPDPCPPESGIGAFARGKITVQCVLRHHAVYHEACDQGTGVASGSTPAIAADHEHRRADAAVLRHDKTTPRMILICVADCPMRSLIFRSWCSMRAYLGTLSVNFTFANY
jgi:hypothetical protein